MRIVIVSNRLPVTVSRQGNGYEVKSSAGGLATALKSWSEKKKEGDSTPEIVWVGWPGIVPTNKSEKQALIEVLRINKNTTGIVLTKKQVEKYYYGFSNKTVWPLFHYFPVYTDYSHETWEYYVQVNQLFADTVCQIIRPGDVVWVHDYQLMLVPKMIKDQMPEVPIGFFLHIPFPSIEIFRLLPKKWRQGIFEGLLGSDLIGFHTYDYAQYFIKSLLRLGGYEQDMGYVRVGNRQVKVDAYPLGIEYDKFCNLANCEDTVKQVQEIAKSTKGAVILSVDRLDYTKGILNRLDGYQLFLDKNPQWQSKVTMVLIAVPSREGVDHYQLLKKQVDEKVGMLNGKFGSVNWTPVLYQFRCLPLEELVPFYCGSNVAMVTPFRDGMNLIAKEYVACCTDKMGVLILSEMAGAASEMPEAIIINPNDIDEIADALRDALAMPAEEQIERNTLMQKRLQRYDVTHGQQISFRIFWITLRNKRKKKLPSWTKRRKKEFSKVSRRLKKGSYCSITMEHWFLWANGLIHLLQPMNFMT